MNIIDNPMYWADPPGPLEVSQMTDKVEERFQRIERNLEITAAIHAEIAAILKAYLEESRAYIRESREARQSLEANMKAFIGQWDWEEEQIRRKKERE